MAQPSNRFLGKYRGRVVDVADPMRRGRIRAQVADVLGEEVSTWATPCLPFTAEQAGHFNVPRPGAGVWIEFEQGDPSYPIWSGCWYGTDAELPPDALTALNTTPSSYPVVIRTPSGSELLLEDRPGGGVILRAPGGASLTLDDDGVRMVDGKGGIVTLRDGKFDVNGGAFNILRRR